MGRGNSRESISRTTSQKEGIIMDETITVTVPTVENTNVDSTIEARIHALEEKIHELELTLERASKWDEIGDIYDRQEWHDMYERINTAIERVDKTEILQNAMLIEMFIDEEEEDEEEEDEEEEKDEEEVITSTPTIEEIPPVKSKSKDFFTNRRMRNE